MVAHHPLTRVIRAPEKAMKRPKRPTRTSRNCAIRTVKYVCEVDCTGKPIRCVPARRPTFTDYVRGAGEIIGFGADVVGKVGRARREWG